MWHFCSLLYDADVMWQYLYIHVHEIEWWSMPLNFVIAFRAAAVSFSVTIQIMFCIPERYVSSVNTVTNNFRILLILNHCQHIQKRTYYLLSCLLPTTHSLQTWLLLDDAIAQALTNFVLYACAPAQRYSALDLARACSNAISKFQPRLSHHQQLIHNVVLADEALSYPDAPG